MDSPPRASRFTERFLLVSSTPFCQSSHRLQEEISDARLFPPSVPSFLVGNWRREVDIVPGLHRSLESSSPDPRSQHRPALASGTQRSVGCGVMRGGPTGLLPVTTAWAGTGDEGGEGGQWRQVEWRQEGTDVCVSGRKWGDMVATRPEWLPVLKGLIVCITVIHKLLHRLPRAPISRLTAPTPASWW